ncbi:Regulator of chromosome condensation, RCC1 [Kalmanozyma brasiliensis GHG001]|uniref:Regulator of chromosome condensation, RCC1 n=1 Tax=Kalmanozyma brasiliensis (strain GHG001) TaxID=1365824 RepID=UPI001CE78D97|nr:Regulator of chromosome condensation, RCC1 [Kalmanozyma brasiliensis GHG001]KAF6767612.1 Regulator of chromosome condensation, RCC1 [Kalmanozyma brasiliensis GHG001]
MMTKTLLVAGSNSGYQLGLGHDRDVGTLQEAICRVGLDPQDVTSFPPEGYTILDLSSGGNHTLALLDRISAEHGSSRTRVGKEIWVAGTGAEGQLEPAHAALSPCRPVQVFTRLDLEGCLQCCDDLHRSASSGACWQPKRIVCGWNCSYIVLEGALAGDEGASRQDVLISLGKYRHNTFGELGNASALALSVVDRTVHQVSFAEALVEAGLDADVAFKIVDVAAGIRHAVAAISIEQEASGQSRMLVVGWGSARQGQVGRIPEVASHQPGPSRRPGGGPPAPVVSVPQLIFDWQVRDPRVARCRVRAGRHHTAVLFQGDDKVHLHCIGSNQQAQLLDLSRSAQEGSSTDDIADMTCNWNSTLALRNKPSGGAILGCGNNLRGQLGDGSLIPTNAANPMASVDLSEISQQLPSGATELNKLVSGSEHSLLLVSRQSGETADAAFSKDSTQVWGWGWNEHGNLAQGPHDEADRGRPVILLDGSRSGAATLPNFYTPLDVWAGCGTSFILAERHPTSCH